ncbi:MAG: CheR family methyltransferase [Spirochaetota bacterium]|nr:CheR family methyltransferase [Spirochaetota bacterium]
MNNTILGTWNLKDEEFELFRDLIYREAGINLTEVKKALVQSRLMKRLRLLKLNDYQEYFNFLLNNYEEEKINLINCITTNKTNFYREPKHFDFIRDVALPKFEKNNKGRIRIWSAGCSTGEEPYTIAITVYEYFKGRKMPDVKILATDIDTEVLKKGELGIYKSDVLNDVDSTILKKYFLKGRNENEGHYRVMDKLKDIVYFRRLNLLDKVFPMRGKFDIIFCRNVVIYFDQETRKDLISRFIRYLNGDGYFFAGHSETLTGVTDQLHLIGHTIYGKAD